MAAMSIIRSNLHLVSFYSIACMYNLRNGNIQCTQVEKFSLLPINIFTCKCDETRVFDSLNTLTHNSWLYFAFLSDTLCLVAAPNGGCFSATGLKTLEAVEYFTPASYYQFWLQLEFFIWCLVHHSISVSSPIWSPKTPLLLLSESCGLCWAPSMIIEGVCRLQLLLALSSAVIFGSDPRGNNDYILLSQIRDCPNMGGQVPVFISPRKRVAQLYATDTWLQFPRLLRLAGLQWIFPNPNPHGLSTY
jgi:hypothetical protein